MWKEEGRSMGGRGEKPDGQTALSIVFADFYVERDLILTTCREEAAERET